MQDFEEALQLFNRKPLAAPAYAFKLHERDSQLQALAQVIVTNFVYRAQPSNAGYGCVLIPGGFCFGKTRLGFEAQFIDQAIFQRVRQFSTLAPDDQDTLLQSMKEPLYIYLNLGNGQALDPVLDAQRDEVRLGVRLGTQLLGVSVGSILAQGNIQCWVEVQRCQKELICFFFFYTSKVLRFLPSSPPPMCSPR